MSSIRSAVLASGNPGKLRELRELLMEQIRLIDMRELGLLAAEETGSSFEENARLKAFAAAEQSGLPALSDDSGLEVDALGGAPGIYSSRYAGDDANAWANIRKLLKDLEDVPTGNRTARFRCVLVMVTPDNEQAPLIAEGVWEGRIAARAEGHQGFGYDPVFLDERTSKCAALMSAAEKGHRSHRGRAARELLRLLGRQGERVSA